MKSARTAASVSGDLKQICEEDEEDFVEKGWKKRERESCVNQLRVCRDGDFGFLERKIKSSKDGNEKGKRGGGLLNFVLRS